MTAEQYDKFVDALIDQTIRELKRKRDAHEDPNPAIETYLIQAYGNGVSIAEAIDFFGVDTPNIAESAGYGGAEMDGLMRRFDAINARLAPQYFK